MSSNIEILENQINSHQKQLNKVYWEALNEFNLIALTPPSSPSFDQHCENLKKFYEEVASCSRTISEDIYESLNEMISEGGEDVVVLVKIRQNLNNKSFTSMALAPFGDFLSNFEYFRKARQLGNRAEFCGNLVASRIRRSFFSEIVPADFEM